jgi:manganese/zinc/iron transport system ATP- binding protein
MHQPSAIETHNLTISYQHKPVLWDVDMNLPEGSLIGVIGPNGSGKSTLLKSIMGLLPLNSGYISLFGEPLEKVRHRISYVPQRETVDWDFPIRVREVVAMGRYGKLTLLGRLSRHDQERIDEAIHKVGLEDFAQRQISQLSGGQQQRVFLARALAQEADLYLMDEPFAGVDAASEQSIIGVLAEMRANGKTVLMVHHDLQTVADYFDWMVLLNTRLIASGPVGEVFTEELLRQAYGGQLNILSSVQELIRARQFPVREEKGRTAL